MEKAKQLSGAKWILVMDSEDEARSNMRLMLEQEGYKVCLAANGDEAIDCYKEAHRCGYPFDAVIVDLHVPKGRSVHETIRSLFECDHRVKVIAMGGDVADSFSEDIKHGDFKGVLKKPFTSGSLRQIVHNVISSESHYQWT